MKLRENFYEGSLNTISFAKLNLIMSFSIYVILRKKWRVKHHSIELTQSLLNQLKWDFFHHPTYLPDLARSDYHLIPSLKCDLGGRHFTMEEDCTMQLPSFSLNRMLSGIPLVSIN